MSPKPNLPPVQSIESFSSPADHVPVLLNEVIAALLSMESPSASTERGSRTLVDGTFGRGGHSRYLLQRLSTRDQLLAIDRDPDAAHAANLLAAKDQRFSFMQARFSELGRVLSTAASSMLMEYCWTSACPRLSLTVPTEGLVSTQTVPLICEWGISLGQLLSR